MIYFVTGANYDLTGKKVEGHKVCELHTNFYYIKTLLSEGYHKNFPFILTNLGAYTKYYDTNELNFKKFEKENKYDYICNLQDSKLLDYNGNKVEVEKKQYIVLFKDMKNKKDNKNNSYLVLDIKGNIHIWKYNTLYKNVTKCSNVNYNNDMCSIQVHAPDISEVIESEEKKWEVNFNKHIEKNKKVLNEISDNMKCYNGVLSMLEAPEYEITMGNNLTKMCDWVKSELYKIDDTLKRMSLRERKLIIDFIRGVIEIFSISGNLYGGISTESILAPKISLTIGGVTILHHILEKIKGTKEIKDNSKLLIKQYITNYKNTLLLVYSLNKIPSLHKEVDKALKLDIVDLFPIEFIYNNFFTYNKNLLILLDKKPKKNLFTRKHTTVRALELLSYDKYLKTKLILSEENIMTLAVAYFTSLFFISNDENKNQINLGKCEVFKSDNYTVVSDKPFDYNTTLLFNSWYLYTFAGLCRHVAEKELEYEKSDGIRGVKRDFIFEALSIIIEILKYRVQITNKCKFYVKPNNSEVTIYSNSNTIIKTKGVDNNENKQKESKNR